MIDAGISPGDLVLVRKQSEATDRCSKGVRHLFRLKGPAKQKLTGRYVYAYQKVLAVVLQRSFPVRFCFGRHRKGCSYEESEQKQWSN